MVINLTLLLIIAGIFLFLSNKIKKLHSLLLAKVFFQIGILILFVGGFFKLFVTLQPNLYLRLIFCLTYIWCTAGINVNFMIPLIDLIDKKIDKYK